MGVPFYLLQHKYGAQALWESHHRLSQLGEVEARVSAIRCGEPKRIIEWCDTLTPISSGMHERETHHDTREPGAQVATLIVVFERVRQSHEEVVDYILRIKSRAAYPIRGPE